MTEWIRTCERREQLSGHERERGRRRSRSWSEGREFLDSGEGCITISGLHQGAVAGRGKLVASRRASANRGPSLRAPAPPLPPRSSAASLELHTRTATRATAGAHLDARARALDLAPRPHRQQHRRLLISSPARPPSTPGPATPAMASLAASAGASRSTNRYSALQSLIADQDTEIEDELARGQSPLPRALGGRGMAGRAWLQELWSRARTAAQPSPTPPRTLRTTRRSTPGSRR